ncbi:hypothetical protein [Deinococcus humi]|uniref:Alpha/beta hydrolase n=1 Tax=Deinococcus humi TaxID=662880 RepID=A0A7W8NFB4_9DEIO|nr:hypothetical protein [Deinococcus humi]MBB5365234.1 hypothetical protein [Deinococcus humi]GGO35702.1 hypothetical protein GCM10008949_38600 [Deinococcus humi]
MHPLSALPPRSSTHLARCALTAFLSLWLALPGGAWATSGQTLPDSLSGPDTDSNGIRDDLDVFISATYPAAEQRSRADALRDYARSLQRATVANERPNELWLGVQALVGLQARGEARWISLAAEVRSRTLNTTPRLNAYAAFQGRVSAQSGLIPLAGASSESGTLDHCQRDCTIILFQNGILTPEERALSSVWQLQKLLGNSYRGQRLIYGLNYNPTDGLADFLEVFRQKLGERLGGASEFGRDYGAPDGVEQAIRDFLTSKLSQAVKVPTSPGGLLAALSNPTSLLQPQAAVPSQQEVTGAVEDYARTYLDRLVKTTVKIRTATQASTYTDARIAPLTDNIETLLRQGLPVVLVAHSQGNLYAEVVIRELQRRQVPLERFRMVGVAVPNDHVPLGSRYITTRSDLVIAALGLVFPVLATNDTSVPPMQQGGAFMGHAFTEVYTNTGHQVALTLKQAIEDAIAQVNP